MFSMLSKNICIELTENGIKEEEIISPFYSSTNSNLNKKDGVGLFHDRIIFRADNFKIKNFGAVKENAIKKTVKMFGFTNEAELEYFKRYFLVSAFEYYSDNPVIDSSKALDSLELSKPFVEEKNKNPLLTLFTSDNTEHKNEKILKQIAKLGITDWQLFKDNKKGVCTIEDLASRNIPEELKKKYKKYKYYAIVRSDGDRMGKIISSLKDDGEIHSFSEKCLEYCSKVSELVHTYDGITIYSGGDDLLALLPVENGDCKTIFDFVKDANKVFKESFEEYKDAGASLSFGIFVSYVRFPLYEALEQSANLLFGVAKERRNAVAVHFQKHAGQSEGLLISNDSIDRFIKLHKTITEENAENKSEILLSAMHKLALFSDIFNSADGLKETKNIFQNTFDADAHKDNSFLSVVLPVFFSGLRTKNIKIYPITEKGVDLNENDCVLTMTYILRIIKFFTESAGET